MLHALQNSLHGIQQNFNVYYYNWWKTFILENEKRKRYCNMMLKTSGMKMCFDIYMATYSMVKLFKV